MIVLGAKYTTYISGYLQEGKSNEVIGGGWNFELIFSDYDQVWTLERN